MTIYISFRADNFWGSVAPARIYEGNGDTATPRLKDVRPEALATAARGRNVLFATHGFNVNREEGIRALGRLEPLLALGASDLFVGVLWPGDFWIPAINYPFEGSDAIKCGKLLADFCKRWLKAAASFSFVSHSLGARLVLEAVKRLDRKAKSVCLTAAAIDRDCLTREYALAFANAERISVLASHWDTVLMLAYPAGDLFSGVWETNNDVFQAALGFDGPPAPVGATQRPWQIDDDLQYGHGNYLPPSSESVDPQTPQTWIETSGFMRRAFRGGPQTWPPQ